MVKATNIRVILSLTIIHKWNIQQININNTFLNGDLYEENYTQQPPGFSEANSQLVWKLNKASYDLKQAPHAWYEKLHQATIQLGSSSSKCNNSLFIYNHNNIKLYALIYVYDILITGSSSKFIHDLINKLILKFTLKQLGAPWYFLSVEVYSQPHGSLLHKQTK